MPIAAESAIDAMAAGKILGRIRKGLDTLYLISGYLAAFCMVGILAMTMLQIGARYTGWSIRGATDYAGYFMAAAAFLGFPYALNQGAHIRIELFLSLLGPRRGWAERVSFSISSGIAIWFAYFCWKQAYWSYKLGDMSQGLDATPVWIPQMAMPLGASLLALAIIDHTVRLLFTGQHGMAPDKVGH